MEKLLTVFPDQVDPPTWHQYMIGSIAPRPIAWVSTQDAQGIYNLAPYSYFGAMSSRPPVVVIGPAGSARTQKPKDTLQNLFQVPEAVIHVVSYDLAARMNITTGEYDPDIDEWEKAGLRPAPASCVRPPRLLEAPIQIECKVRQIFPLGESPLASHIVVLDIVCMHFRREVLDAENLPDPYKVDSIARLGRFWYTRTREGLFWMSQPRDPQTILSWEELPQDIRQSTILTAHEIGELLAHRQAAQGISQKNLPPDKIQELHRLMQKFLREKNPRKAWEVYKDF
ncbi:MAG: flavin reductase family protein [Bacteroidia bacterium]